MGDGIDADMEADEDGTFMDVGDGSGILALNLAKQERRIYRIYAVFSELYDSSVDKIWKYYTILLHWKRRKLWTARSLENLLQL